MYLWNSKSLIQELRKGTLSQYERFKYLLFQVTITVIIIELATYYVETPLGTCDHNFNIVLGDVATFMAFC